MSGAGLCWGGVRGVRDCPRGLWGWSSMVVVGVLGAGFGRFSMFGVGVVVGRVLWNCMAHFWW